MSGDGPGDKVGRNMDAVKVMLRGAFELRTVTSGNEGRVANQLEDASYDVADLIEAAQWVQLVEHGDGTWLIFRSSVENNLGAGSILLHGAMAEDARNRFAKLKDAIARVKGEE